MALDLTLKLNSDEMRDVAGSLDNLISVFDNTRVEMKSAVEQELNETCEGDIAAEFANNYNETVDSGFIEERERLERVSQTLKTAAGNFDDTTATVKASNNR